MRRGVEFLLGQAQPFNRGEDAWPLFGEKLFALTLKQRSRDDRANKHSETAPGFDQLLVDQLCRRFQDGQRINPVVGWRRCAPRAGDRLR